MLTNLQNPEFDNIEENEKVIWNTHTDLDRYQKSITSGGSSLSRHGKVRCPSHVQQLRRPVLCSRRTTSVEHATTQLKTV